MSNNKQSSVEWFAEESWKLRKEFEGGKISNGEYANKYDELLKKAKAMHKEEIIEVWIDAYTTNMKRLTRDNFILWAENYYNETYEGDK